MEQKDKEAYKLWWEFLKLSDNYREFVENPPWKRKRLGPGPHTITIPLKWDSESYKFYYETNFGSNFKKGVSPDSLIQTSYLFGNVHELSFEGFWKNLPGRRKKLSKHKKIPVSEFKSEFEFWSSIYEMDCKQKSKKPDFEDFKKLILNCLKNNEKRYLTIDLRCPIGEINNSIKQFVNKDIKKGIKDKITKDKWLKCYQLCFPTPNLRVDEVNRYLKVLKIFKSGLKGKSAFKELNPNGDYDDPDQRTAFYSDKRKAERILKNVEKGYFPGIYEKNLRNNLHNNM